mgnify:FL=1
MKSKIRNSKDCWYVTYGNFTLAKLKTKCKLQNRYKKFVSISLFQHSSLTEKCSLNIQVANYDSQF